MKELWGEVAGTLSLLVVIAGALLGAGVSGSRGYAGGLTMVMAGAGALVASCGLLALAWLIDELKPLVTDETRSGGRNRPPLISRLIRSQFVGAMGVIAGLAFMVVGLLLTLF